MAATDNIWPSVSLTSVPAASGPGFGLALDTAVGKVDDPEGH